MNLCMSKIGNNIEYLKNRYNICAIDNFTIPTTDYDAETEARTNMIIELLEIRDGLCTLNAIKAEIDAIIDWACTY